MSTVHFARAAGLSIALVAGAFLGGPAVAGAETPALPAVAEVAGAASTIAYDFNGDGLSDLAVGVPGEDIKGVRDTGGVNVIYAGALRLTAKGDQFWSQRTPGVPGKSERGDRFGSELASGDFDGDGYADLVIESGGENLLAGGQVWGAMTVLYGSKSGLTAAGAQGWGPSAFPGRTSDEDHGVGGMRYLPGDFNDDGYADLAVGYDVQATTYPDGWVFWGSTSGLAATAVKIAGTPLAAGDMTGDGVDDLVVTSPTTPSWTKPWQLLLGSAATPLAQRLDAPSDGRYLETSDHVVCDLDADGSGELVRIGTEGDGPPYSLLVQGASATAVDAATEFTQPQLGIASDEIWHGLACGDLTEDGAADVAISMWASSPDGAVAVVLGSTTDLLAAPAQVWSQDTPGVKGHDEAGDGFGNAVRIGRFSGRTYAEIAIGAPGEDNGRGRVTVLRGSATGLTDVGDRTWSQDSKGILGSAERFDQFGYALG